MGDLVLVTSKRVEKYSSDDNELVDIFESINQCSEIENISTRTIRKKNCAANSYNGFYYKIIENKPYYIKAICDYCGIEFDCQRFRAEDGRKHLFCSHKCEGAFRKSQTKLNCVCEICGKPYHMKQSHIDRYGSKYCSKKCHREAKKIYMSGEKNHQYGLKGDKNASWKSDERISYYRYKLIRCLEHPFANCDGFVFEHRLVAEKYLLNDENSIVINNVRYLSSEFVVHHIDFNRLNNDKNNLIVMRKDEHARLHQSLRNNKCLMGYCNKHNLNFNCIKERMLNSPKWHRL